MNDFVIYTDSPCDISPATLAEWGVGFSSLSFRFDGEEQDYLDNDLTSAEFYAKMRAGGVAKTSALNAETFKEGFEPILKEGRISITTLALEDEIRLWRTHFASSRFRFLAVPICR